MNLIEQINNHRYLFLAEICEQEENSLRIIVEEGRLGEQITKNDLKKASNEIEEAINSVRLGSYPVIIDGSCCKYEITFNTYIAYFVRNESYSNFDESSNFSGKFFGTYLSSQFLDFLKISTWATEDYPGKFNHYGLFTEHSIVDIASVSDPEIKTLQQSQTWGKQTKLNIKI